MSQSGEHRVLAWTIHAGCRAVHSVNWLLCHPLRLPTSDEGETPTGSGIFLFSQFPPRGTGPILILSLFYPGSPAPPHPPPGVTAPPRAPWGHSHPCSTSAPWGHLHSHPMSAPWGHLHPRPTSAPEALPTSAARLPAQPHPLRPPCRVHRRAFRPQPQETVHLGLCKQTRRLSVTRLACRHFRS